MINRQAKKQLVADLYFKENKTPTEIAKQLDISNQWVYSILSSYQIKIVPSSTKRSVALGVDVCKLFTERGLTPREIASELDKSLTTVLRHLEKAGLYKRKHKSPPLAIERDVLVDLYKTKGIRAPEIAKMYNVTTSCVYANLFRLNIKNGVRNRVFIEEEDLRSMYIDEKLTSREIAKIFNMNVQTVCSRLTKYKIRREAVSVEEVIELLDKGLSQNKAAKHLGISQAKISVMIKKYNKERKI